MTGPPPARCPSCGAAIENRFCGACGEKRVTAHDYSITHFAEHVLENFTHFDFKSLRAFKTLMAQPGRLTRDYLDGRRRNYIGPIQLFVIVNVVFALVGPTTFRTPLSVQEQDAPFVEAKRALVAGAIAERRIDKEAFRRSFDEAAGLQAKTWVFAMIPLLALATAAIYGFRRFLFEHLIFTTHFLAFTLAWTLVAGLVLSWGLRAAGIHLGAHEWDNLVSSIILVGLAAYLFVALRRVFGDRVPAAAARALALTLLFFPIVLVYRFLLFFVTLQTMH
jgi:hypothetical protein